MISVVVGLSRAEYVPKSGAALLSSAVDANARDPHGLVRGHGSSHRDGISTL